MEIFRNIARPTFRTMVAASILAVVLLGTGIAADFLGSSQADPDTHSPNARSAAGALGSEGGEPPPPETALDPPTARVEAPVGAPAGPGISLSCRSDAGDNDIAKSCMVKSHHGFTGEVSLSCAGNPSSIGCVFDPPSVGLAPGGSAVSRLTLMPQNVPSGSYRFKAVAAGGSVSGTFALSWKADNPAGSGYPVLRCPGTDSASTPHSVVAGGQVEVRCEMESFYGYGGPVRLSCHSHMGPISCTPDRSELTLAPHQIAAAVFRISTPKDMQAGTFRFEVTYSGVGASPVVRTPTVFHVRASRPNVDISCSPRDMVVEQGSIATTNCKITSSDGFSDEFNLMVEGGFLQAELSRSTAGVGDVFQILIPTSPSTPPGRYEYFLGYASVESKFVQGSYTVVPGPPPAG